MASVNFADVKKIVIPEGDVRRITQTSDGTVLWEKTADYTQVIKGTWSWNRGRGVEIYAGWMNSARVTYPYWRVRVEGGTFPASLFQDLHAASSRNLKLTSANLSHGGVVTQIELPTSSTTSQITVASGDTGWKDRFSDWELTDNQVWLSFISQDQYWFNNSVMDGYFFTDNQDCVTLINQLTFTFEFANYKY